MDYMFLGKDDEETSPALVMIDNRSGAVFATWVPNKGASAEWVMRRVVMFLNSLG